MVKGSRLRTKTSVYHSQRSDKSSPASAQPLSSSQSSLSSAAGNQEKTNRNAGFPSRQPTPKTPKTSSDGKVLSTEYMKGRLAIKAVTMNLSGQSVMGLTPAYKLNYIRFLLQGVPK